MRIYFIIISSILTLLSAQDVTYEAYFSNDDGIVEEKAKTVKGEVFDSKMMVNPIATIETSSFLFFFKSNKLKISRKLFNGNKIYIKFTYVDKESGILYEPVICSLEKDWIIDKSISGFHTKNKDINPIDNVQLIEDDFPYRVKLVIKRAKTIIKGQILDKNNKPIDNVTVQIRKIKTYDGIPQDVLSNRRLSDSFGNFKFEESFKTDSPGLEMKLLFVKKGFIPKYMKLGIYNQKENNLTTNLYESADGTVIPAEYCYEHNQIYNKICGECDCDEGEKWYPEIINCDQICEKGKAPTFIYLKPCDPPCEGEVKSCEDEVVPAPIPIEVTPSTNKSVRISFVNNQNLKKKNMEVYYGDWIDEEELDEITFDTYQSDDKLYKIGEMKDGHLDVINNEDVTFCGEHNPKPGKTCNVFEFDAQYFVEGIPIIFIFVDLYYRKLFKYSLDIINESRSIDLTSMSMFKIELNFDNQGSLLTDKILYGYRTADDKRDEYVENSDYFALINNTLYKSQYRLSEKKYKTPSHCDIHLGNINGFIDDCNWNDGANYIKNKGVLSDCSKDMYDAQKIYKLIKVLGKYVLKAEDEEIINYIQGIENQNQNEITILMGLYNFFYKQDLINTESWKNMSQCDVSKFFLEKASFYYKLFTNLLILETESIHISQNKETIEQLIYCPECPSDKMFTTHQNGMEDIFHISEWVEKYYMEYKKYAEDAKHSEGCVIIPVDDRIKMIKEFNPAKQK